MPRFIWSEAQLKLEPKAVNSLGSGLLSRPWLFMFCTWPTRAMAPPIPPAAPAPAVEVAVLVATEVATLLATLALTITEMVTAVRSVAATAKSVLSSTVKQFVHLAVPLSSQAGELALEM